MKAPSCAARRSPQRARTDSGSRRGGDDAGGDGVLPVVADVGDAVGPAHHLALGGGRGRPGPAVVADAVEGLGAQVERGQRDVGPPRGVVEAAGEVGVEGVLAGVAARAVAAVVAEGDGLGERHVEPAGPGHAGGHLGHLQGVGEAGPLVVLGEDEDLGLAGQPAEGGGVQDPVPVPLEAGAPRVGLLGRARCPRPRPGWPRRQHAVLVRLRRAVPAAARPTAAPGPSAARRWPPESAWATRTDAGPVAGRCRPRPAVVARRPVPRRGRRGSRPWWPPSGGSARSGSDRLVPHGTSVPRACIVGGHAPWTVERRPAGAGRRDRGVTPGGRAHRDHPDPQGARGRAGRRRRPGRGPAPTSRRRWAGTTACSG